MAASTPRSWPAAGPLAGATIVDLTMTFSLDITPVSDVNGTLTELTARAVPLLDRGARPGASGTRIAFLDPRGFAGSLLELVEETAESRAVNAHTLDAGWIRYCGALPSDRG